MNYRKSSLIRKLAIGKLSSINSPALVFFSNREMPMIGRGLNFNQVLLRRTYHVHFFNQAIITNCKPKERKRNHCSLQVREKKSNCIIILNRGQHNEKKGHWISCCCVEGRSWKYSGWELLIDTSY